MIVEDEGLMADKMEMQIDKLGHDLFTVVDNSDDALEALQKEQPDLILMDVNIEGEYDGIELTDMIHQQWPIPVLFITSLHDDATFRRISRTNPVGYVLKPFSDAQLKHSIDLVLKQLTLAKQEEETSYVMEEIPKETEEYIFIKKRNQLDKVKIVDIFYIEADGRYSQIYTIDNKYLIRLSLKELSNRLNPNSFLQTHRSFVVNIERIKKVDLEGDTIVLENRHIPISRRERQNVLDRLDWI